jgi:hypothetical protein
MRLYLDDVRVTPHNFDLRAYTADEAIELLETGQVDFISFDHDLGPAEAGTGYDVALWIEEQAATNPAFRVPDWAVHSANPVGAVKIHKAMINAELLEHLERTR